MTTSRQRRAAQKAGEPAKRPGKVSPMAVARSSRKPTREAVNPFDKARLARAFPFDAKAADDAQIAQDEAVAQSLNWAADGYANYALDEGVAFLGYPYLASLAQRAEYRKIVDVIATEMTRKWIRFTAWGEEDKGDRIKAIEAAFERLSVREVFRRAAEHDGFFGRAHVFVGLKGDDTPDERASSIGDGHDATAAGKVQKGGLLRLQAVEPYWIAANPQSFNSTDPLAADFYRPNNWNVLGHQVHASRLLTFIGRTVPDILKPVYAFGGLAMTQMAKPYVDNWVRTREDVSKLISSFSTSGVKNMQLAAALAEGDMESLFNRIDVYNNLRDNRGFMALGEGEEFFNISTPLGTLDKLQAQAQEQMASVSGIPLVKLLGVTPSGLNASSDGEIRVFYDYIHAYQERLFAPNLKRILGFVMLSEFGEVDESIGFDFEPLWQMSDAEKADVALKRTQAVMTAEPALPQTVVMRELREMADGTGVFTQITDEDIAEVEANPPLPEVPEPDADADDPSGAEPLPAEPDNLSRLPQAAE